MTMRKLAERKCDKKRPHKKRAGKPAEAQPDEWSGQGLNPKQRAFLEAYSSCGSLRLAAKAAHVARCNHYRWLKCDPKYAEAFEVARESAGQALEDEARRRAVEGVREPVYYEGDVCGHRQRYSDNLLMFLLKGINPEKYRERADVTHRGDKEQPIPVDMDLGAELLRKVIGFAGKPGAPGMEVDPGG